MRRIVLRLLVTGLLLAVLGVAWIAGARSLSLFLDRLHTVEIESRPVAELGVPELSGGMIRIDSLQLNMSAAGDQPPPLRMSISAAHQLLVEKDGRSLTLGKMSDSLGTIRPAPNDTARFEIRRSLLSWPTPLELNFMTGASPSWKRHLYYRLIWQKPGGGRLEMVWRYEQWFYEGWASGFMTHSGSTGLIRADVQP